MANMIIPSKASYIMDSADIVPVRARAPLRLGLAGGGTDLSPYCDEFGGAVINVTIDRYAYAHLAPRDDEHLLFRANDLDLEDRIASAYPLDLKGGLQIHRAVHERMCRDYLGGARPSLTVSTNVDSPPGSGLGSSSALVVALVEAYRAAFELPLGRYDVAHLAFEIERIDLGLAGGKQDQYAAAFGGVNFIEFLADDRVIVNPLRVSDAALNELEAAMVVCFTGQSRSSADIIEQQVAGIRQAAPKTIDNLHKLKADAIEMKQSVLRGDLESIANILGSSWTAKRATAAGISNPLMEELYDLALRSGARAGKVSGAGGGGFMMFVADPECRYRMVSALRKAGVDAGPVHFTSRGVEAWPMPR
jgi:D-glycero-alpha-D-manno-heptose-7-phosphate kinase